MKFILIHAEFHVGIKLKLPTIVLLFEGLDDLDLFRSPLGLHLSSYDGAVTVVLAAIRGNLLEVEEVERYFPDASVEYARAMRHLGDSAR